MPAIANPKSSPKEIVGHHGHRPHGKSILWPALYEHLRRKGYSKEKAARISNSAWNKKHAGLPTNLPTSARGIAKLRAASPWASDIAYEHRPLPGGRRVSQINKSDLPQEVVEYIDQLEEYAESVETERDEATAKVAELEAAGVGASVEKGDPLEEVLAKADPAVRAVLEKQAKDIEAANEKLAKVAEAEQEREMVSKSAALTKITTPKEELTETLKAVYAVDGELGDKVFKMLQDANTQIETGALFEELGKTGAQTTVASSVESLAEEIRKSDPSLTKEQAIAKAYEVNPNLYLEELKGN